MSPSVKRIIAHTILSISLIASTSFAAENDNEEKGSAIESSAEKENKETLLLQSQYDAEISKSEREAYQRLTPILVEPADLRTNLYHPEEPFNSIIANKRDFQNNPNKLRNFVRLILEDDRSRGIINSSFSPSYTRKDILNIVENAIYEGRTENLAQQIDHIARENERKDAIEAAKLLEEILERKLSKQSGKRISEGEYLLNLNYGNYEEAYLGRSAEYYNGWKTLQNMAVDLKSRPLSTEDVSALARLMPPERLSKQSIARFKTLSERTLDFNTNRPGTLIKAGELAFYSLVAFLGIQHSDLNISIPLNAVASIGISSLVYSVLQLIKNEILLQHYDIDTLNRNFKDFVNQNPEVKKAIIESIENEVFLRRQHMIKSCRFI